MGRQQLAFLGLLEALAVLLLLSSIAAIQTHLASSFRLV